MKSDYFKSYENLLFRLREFAENKFDVYFGYWRGLNPIYEAKEMAAIIVISTSKDSYQQAKVCSGMLRHFMNCNGTV